MENTAKFLRHGVSVLAALLCATAAQGAEAVPESLRQCAAIADGAQRLACLDEALQQLGVSVAVPPQAPGTQPAAAAAVPAAGAVAAASVPPLTPEQKFGATGELKQKQEPKPQEPALEALTANIKDVRQSSSGHYVVTLDNGQVWRQVTPADMMMRPGEPVTIKPRTFGSFWLIDASGRGSRFKRIQ